MGLAIYQSPKSILDSKDKIFTPVIELHSSWIAVNPIQGCPKNCKYCFLQSYKQTGVAPKEVLSPLETIKALLNFKYYNPSTPLCFLTHTDPISNSKNRKALLELITLCKDFNINNIKCFSTKCPFPPDFVEALVKLQESGEKIIIYISFSGLDNTIERGVDHKRLYESLELLKSTKIPIIHFWRPFIPQNSTIESIHNVLDKMMPYAKASVISGLKLDPDMIPQIDFWPAIQKNTQSSLQAESVWPKGVLNYLQNLPSPYDKHPIYISNSCAISYVMNTPDLGAFYNSKSCKINRCPSNQKAKCENFHKNSVFNKNEVENTLLHLGIDKGKIANVSVCNEISVTSVDNCMLTIEDIVYFRHVTRSLINGPRKDSYWSSSASGAEPFELG